MEALTFGEWMICTFAATIVCCILWILCDLAERLGGFFNRNDDEEDDK